MSQDSHGRRRVGARAAGSKTGAVAAGGGDRRRRGGWLWLLLILAALLAALILWLALRHRGNGVVAVAPSSSPTQSAVVPSTSPTTANPTPPATISATATTPSATAPASAEPTASADTTASSGALVSSAAPGSTSPTGLGKGAAAVGGGLVTAHQITNAAPGLMGAALFAAGSTSVDPQGRGALAMVAANLRATHASTVTVTGFANDLPTAAGNTALAEARAAAAAAVLRRDLAGSSTVVRTLAVGQTDPAQAETTAGGRLADARATVTLPGTALIGGDGVEVHPAAGSATVPVADPAGPASTLGVALFADSSAQLDAADRAVISAAAARITAEHASSVMVTGYTDSVGGATGALTLSRQRAEAVADALRADLGTGAPTITVRALGATDQIASDATADGRRLNRRTVITTG